MGADDVLGDGQAQAMAVRAVLGMAGAEERFKNAGQVGAGHAGAAVQHGNAQQILLAVMQARQIHFHRATVGAVLDGIAHHVFHGARQQFRPARDSGVGNGRVARQGDADLARLRLVAGIFQHVVQQVGDADVFAKGRAGARFQPRQGQQLADQLIHAFAFAFDALQRGVHLVRLLVRQTDGRLQARQRRAQFVRHIVQQTRLALHEAAQTARHAVEIAAQVRQFIAALAAGVKTRRQVAMRGSLECLPQVADGTRKIPGQQEREQQAGGDGGGQRNEGAVGAVHARARWHAAAEVAAWRRGARCVGLWTGSHAARAAHGDGVERVARRARFGIAETFGRGQKQQVAHAVAADHLAHHGMGQALRQQRAGLGQHGGMHRAAHQFFPLGIDGEYAHAFELAQELPQGLAAARFHGGAGRLDDHLRRRTGIDVEGPLLLRRPVFQPEGAADADGGRHLRQHDAQKKLPEQTAHAYSLISW